MAKFDFTLCRKEGWTLNPDDKIVNSILKGLNRCKGLCPCYHGDDIPEEDLKCPCKEYCENDHCRCSLYVREKASPIINVNAYVKEIDSLQKQLMEVEKEKDFYKANYNSDRPKLVY